MNIASRAVLWNCKATYPIVIVMSSAMTSQQQYLIDDIISLVQGLRQKASTQPLFESKCFAQTVPIKEHDHSVHPSVTSQMLSSNSQQERDIDGIVAAVASKDEVDNLHVRLHMRTVVFDYPKAITSSPADATDSRVVLCVLDETSPTPVCSVHESIESVHVQIKEVLRTRFHPNKTSLARLKIETLRDIACTIGCSTMDASGKPLLKKTLHECISVALFNA